MKTSILGMIMLFFSISSVNGSELAAIARETLSKNIVTLPSGSYLRAGGNHFGSLWTRDFAWAIGGLLAMGREDVVHDHLQALMNEMNQAGLIPRVLDSSPSWARVFLGILRAPRRALRDPLRPEYLGEHDTVAIDSNLMVLRGSLLYYQKTQDHAFWERNQERFVELLRFYDHYQWQGWIVQEDYGDWQDSVKRTGVSFLTNYLWWETRERLFDFYSEQEVLERFDFTRADQFELLQKLWTSFFVAEQGLFKSHLSTSLFSIDGHLLALLNPKFMEQSRARKLTSESRESLYQKLKQSPLWSGQSLPGRASWPEYPKAWRSFFTKAVGLSHYHDKMVWSWLTGYSLKLAKVMGDQSEVARIRSKLGELLKRDQGVTEIWRVRPDLPAFRSPLYRSENPFSWGAGVILEALEVR